jgi:hypothetical protein
MTIKEISRNKPKIDSIVSHPRALRRRRQEGMGLANAVLGAVCVVGVFAVLWALYAYG